ncbi:MAG: type II secretion system F family protein [Magnetococcales bacterium]|nr:type II secretion system F family protein [Magnetococcales bacterium]
MAYFRYNLLDKEGHQKTGLISLPFDNPVSAMAYLERQGNVVFSATPLPQLLGRAVGLLKQFFGQKITKEELAEALNNVAVMLKAGLPLMSALQDAIAEHNNATLSQIGKEIVLRVEGGSSLTDAIKGYGHIFSGNVLFLISLGEETGSLDRTIHDAAEHMKKMDKIQKDVKSALRYPAIVFGMIVVAMMFWLYSVVPSVAGVFKSMGAKLPAMTIMVIDISDVVINNAPAFFGAIIAVVMLLKLVTRLHQPTRKVMHTIMLRLPVVKSVLHYYNQAFITEYLALMITAGLDILRSIDILGSTLPNEVYKEKMQMVRSSLLQGIGVRASFQAAKIFPPFVIRMVGVGEQSGTLSDQLVYISEDYRIKLEFMVANIGKMIEPLALGIGGGLFIMLTIALFTPIYDLIQNMSK